MNLVENWWCTDESGEISLDLVGRWGNRWVRLWQLSARRNPPSRWYVNQTRWNDALLVSSKVENRAIQLGSALHLSIIIEKSVSVSGAVCCLDAILRTWAGALLLRQVPMRRPNHSGIGSIQPSPYPFSGIWVHCTGRAHPGWAQAGPPACPSLVAILVARPKSFVKILKKNSQIWMFHRT